MTFPDCGAWSSDRPHGGNRCGKKNAACSQDCEEVEIEKRLIPARRLELKSMHSCCADSHCCRLTLLGRSESSDGAVAVLFAAPNVILKSPRNQRVASARVKLIISVTWHLVVRHAGQHCPRPLLSHADFHALCHCQDAPRAPPDVAIRVI